MRFFTLSLSILLVLTLSAPAVARTFQGSVFCRLYGDESLTFQHKFLKRPLVVEFAKNNPEFRVVLEEKTFEWGPEGSWINKDPSLAYAVSVIKNLKKQANLLGRTQSRSPAQKWELFEALFLEHTEAVDAYIAEKYPHIHLSWRRFTAVLKQDLDREKSEGVQEASTSTFSLWTYIDFYITQLDALIHLPNVQAFQVSLATLPEENEYTSDARMLIYQLSGLLPARIEKKLSNPGKFYKKFRTYHDHLMNKPSTATQEHYLETWIRSKVHDFLIEIDGDLCFVKAKEFHQRVTLQYYFGVVGPAAKNHHKSLLLQMNELHSFNELLGYDKEQQRTRFKIATYFSGEFDPEVKKKIQNKKLIWLDPAEYSEKIEW